MSTSDLSLVMSGISAPVETPSPAAAPTYLQGVVSVHPKGFGFISTADGQRYFTPPGELRRLLAGDVVAFNIVPGHKPDTVQAAVLGVLNRSASTWQGVLTLKGNRMVLVPDADTPCFVQIEVEGISFAMEDIVVSVRIASIESTTPVATSSCIFGRLEQVLGPRSRPGFIQDFALARFDFPVAFSKKALTEADLVAAQPIRMDRRKDLRELPLVTIDGESTRDYDDAVHATATPTGWDLTVAIADVSHYVTPGSTLDREAFARATSVYLPGKLLPMLPESLSTGACSLVPGEDRLAVALSLKVDHAGGVSDFLVERAVVRSAQRLTYADVQAWADKVEPGLPLAPGVEDSLSAMWALFQTLADARAATGRMEFEAPEPKFSFNPDGSLELGWAARTQAHRLVEELMLLSNRAVALRLGVKGGALFRHQANPTDERWESVREFAVAQGHPLPEEPDMPALSGLVQALAARSGQDPEAGFKAELQARHCMSPAVYSAAEPRHFSLNFSAYTHFSSPIRRYADLLVHRLLLNKGVAPLNGLTARVAQCSDRSRAARLAERMVWDSLKKEKLWAVEGKGKTPLAAHLVRQNGPGVRAILSEWQTTVFIPAGAMTQAGYKFDKATVAWARDGVALELGSALNLLVTSRQDTDSRIELNATLLG